MRVWNKNIIKLLTSVNILLKLQENYELKSEFQDEMIFEKYRKSGVH